MRESWTDKRLDEFAARTDERFDAIDRRFDVIDERFNVIDERFNAIDQRFSAIDQRLDAADQRFEMFERSVADGFKRVDDDLRELRTQMAAFQRVVLQLSCGMMITFVVGFAGLIAAQL